VSTTSTFHAVQERAPAPVLGLFGGGTRKVESFATQVERQVESQRTRKGTQVRAQAAANPAIYVALCINQLLPRQGFTGRAASA
jgi:hypothetical protein